MTLEFVHVSGLVLADVLEDIDDLIFLEYLGDLILDFVVFIHVDGNSLNFSILLLYNHLLLIVLGLFIFGEYPPKIDGLEVIIEDDQLLQLAGVVVIYSVEKLEFLFIFVIQFFKYRLSLECFYGIKDSLDE